MQATAASTASTMGLHQQESCQGPASTYTNTPNKINSPGPEAQQALAPWDNRLNHAQRTAASRDVHKPLLIVAGAGTGKTSTLIARILYQVQVAEVPPAAVLAITFTNAAAAEVCCRLLSWGVLSTAASYVAACCRQ